MEVRWEWKATLTPGAKQVLEFVTGDGGEAVVATTAKDVAQWAREFVGQFDGFKPVWEQRWADAFTPGNRHFSGNLPLLATENRELARHYYMGALTMVILERTQFPVAPRSFITSGEREPGTQYFWDAAMQATAWALLEPAGMKATLRRWLVQNVRGSPVTDLRQTQGFDARQHPKITGYAFNACTIFQTAYDYLRVTGDLGFLDEKLETGQGIALKVDPALAAQQYRLRSDGDTLTISGGSEVAVLYGAYAFAEKLGVRFEISGDVVPDEMIPFRIPQLGETHQPLFELRGLQPFHDFPEGPDWWTQDDWHMFVGQTAHAPSPFASPNWPTRRPASGCSAWSCRGRKS